MQGKTIKPKPRPAYQQEDTPHYTKPDELHNTNNNLMGYKKEAHDSIQHQNAHLWNQQHKILPILTFQGRNCTSRLKMQLVPRSKNSLPKI